MAVGNVFRWIRWSVPCFAALLAIAMLAYSGGTIGDPLADYSLLMNPLSDLGRTRALSGRPNYVSMSAFALGLIIVGLSMIVFFSCLASLYRSSRRQQGLARAAAACGIVSGIGYISVALTPLDVSDLFISIHNKSSTFAFIAFFAGSLLFSAATFREPDFSRRSAWSWLSFALLLGIYVVIAMSAPTMHTIQTWKVQIVAQKIIVLVAILGVGYQSYEAERVWAKRLSAQSHPGVT